MSLAALEKILYDLGVQGQARKAFANDQEAFIAQYRLEPNEKKWVSGFEVNSMLCYGVNPMLTLGYWVFLHPSRSMATYTNALKPEGRTNG